MTLAVLKDVDAFVFRYGNQVSLVGGSSELDDSRSLGRACTLLRLGSRLDFVIIVVALSLLLLSGWFV